VGYGRLAVCSLCTCPGFAGAPNFEYEVNSIPCTLRS
jgi:hypothetical protein